VSVAVIVPWRAGCEHRERAWAWVQARYAAVHPAWPLIVAPCPPGPWVKAAAVMPAALATDDDVLIIADADVWCDGLAEAVAAVEAGRSWAMPHLEVHRLTELATATYCDSPSPERTTARRQP
jgi:hypothetical protein